MLNLGEFLVFLLVGVLRIGFLLVGVVSNKDLLNKLTLSLVAN